MGGDSKFEGGGGTFRKRFPEAQPMLPLWENVRPDIFTNKSDRMYPGPDYGVQELPPLKTGYSEKELQELIEALRRLAIPDLSEVNKPVRQFQF